MPLKKSIRGGRLPKKNIKFNTALRARPGALARDSTFTGIAGEGKPPVCYFAKQGPRESMEDTYQIMHFKIVKWFLLFTLIWQGGGGSGFNYNDILVSFLSTLIIYIIYNMPYVKNGSDYLEERIKKYMD